MDKSKSLQRLLNMVLKEKYPYISNIEVNLITTDHYIGPEVGMAYIYEVHVFFDREARNHLDIHKDIKDLKGLILSEPNEYLNYIDFALKRG